MPPNLVRGLMREQDDVNGAMETFKFNTYVHVGVLEEEPGQLTRLQVVVKGKEGTPYEGGSFTFTLQFPPNYPFRPPTTYCETPIWHPLIANDVPTGSSNVLIYFFPESLSPNFYSETVPFGWTPHRTLTDIIQALVDIVHLRPPHWNTLDYINVEAWEQFTRNYPLFDAKARDWTAQQTQGVP